MQPEDDGVFQVARIAPYVKGGAQRWRVRAHFTVMNHGANKLQLVKLVLSYPGSTVKGSTACRWNGKQWTELKSTAKKPFKNTDYLIYGKPVYTMAAGTIVNCAWSAPDNTPGVEGPKQNHFWILHGTGEIALYAHLQAGSVSKKYCPETVAENTFSLNIPIAAGVKLGNVGNSGSSDKPHLHVHVQRAVNGNKISSTGRPLLFRNSSNAGGADSVAIGSGPFSLNPLIGQMPGAPMNLIAP